MRTFFVYEHSGLCGSVLEFHNKKGVVRAVFLAAARLHPFGYCQISKVGINVRYSEVAEASSSFGNGNLFALTDEAVMLGVDLSEEERGAVAEYVVVICALSRIDKIHVSVKSEKMLLGIIVLKHFPIVEAPRRKRGEMLAINTRGI